ncbi:MAG: Adenylate kinase [Parcubacteria group bacterium GW2011_GWC2_38_7]|nr:MAG: Adenylate kinase [Parcubacteria group bacterium GW2011_GWC2_38_7]
MKQKRKLFIFIGPPGSGKGTQAELLTQKYNINYFSVGEILRTEVSQKTKLGKQVNAYLKSGQLAPDEIICQIMFNKLKRSRKNIIFDGFPRNIDQAVSLDMELDKTKIDRIVFEITLPTKKIIERIIGRRYCVCGKTYHVTHNAPKKKNICDACGRHLKTRSDAKTDIIEKRQEIYLKQTAKVLHFYKTDGGYILNKINGDRPILTIHQEISQIIKKLK